MTSTNHYLDNHAATAGWATRNLLEFYREVERQDVRSEQLHAIVSIPMLVLLWENEYPKAFGVEYPPIWLPGYLRVVDRIIQKRFESFLDSDDAGAGARTPQDDPEELAALRAEAEAEVSRELAVVFWQAISDWDGLKKWLRPIAGGGEYPPTPEIEFLLYYSAVLREWAFSKLEEDEAVRYARDLALHPMRPMKEPWQSEFNEVAAENHPDFVAESWDDDLWDAIVLSTGGTIGLLPMAARHWNAYCSWKGDEDELKRLTVNAVLEEYEGITEWAVEVWNPDGPTEIGRGEWSIMAPSPMREHDYLPPTAYTSSSTAKIEIEPSPHRASHDGNDETAKMKKAADRAEADRLRRWLTARRRAKNR